MTVTVDDVKRVHAAEVLRGKTAQEARDGTRTVIYGMLQAEQPPPYSDRPADLVGAEEKRAAAGGKPMLTVEERARVSAHQRAQVTDADKIASEGARTGASTDHRDAHHYVQKMHQIGLWKQTDALVASALGVAS